MVAVGENAAGRLMSIEVVIVVLEAAEAQFSEPVACELPALPDVGDWIHVPRTYRLPPSEAPSVLPAGARLEVCRRHFVVGRDLVQLDCLLVPEEQKRHGIPLLEQDLRNSTGPTVELSD